jgi:uncharacterized delta-60 repeat protein
MSVKGILAGAAVVIASLASAGVTQPAFAAGGTPGSIDTSFGHNGTAVVDLGLDAAGQAKLGTPRTVIVLGNGDILVGGDLGEVRLRPTGSLDPAFGRNGYAPVGFSVANVVGLTGLTVQPDGKILWLGSTPVPNGAAGGNINQFAVERFTANGTPDATFGHHGVVTTDVPTGGFGGESAQTAVVQPDGKIVVGGFTGTFGRTGVSHAALIRYNPGGSLDTSFGHGGTVISGPGDVQAIGLDAAGDIFTLPGEAEFSPGGVQDAHVSAAPITASTPSPLNGNEVSGAFAFLPTGQTLAGGLVGNPGDRFDTDAQVQRLNAGGTVDATFASPPIDYNGIEGGRGASGVDSLAIQPDGKILVGGAVGLARVNADGTLDTTFGTGGAELAVPATLPVVLANAALLAVLPNAKFLAIGAGANPVTGATELILTRYFR